MWASAIVQIEISTDGLPRLRHGVVGPQVDLLVFDRRPRVPDEDVVSRRGEARLRYDASLPSMLILLSFAASTPEKAAPVNGLPWSVLNFSSLPWRASASSSGSTQKAASIMLEACLRHDVIDTRHDRIRRAVQSSTTAR